MIGTDFSLSGSEVEPFSWRGLDFFVKRDDLIDPRFSGNKLRKLYSLFNVDSGRFHKVVSFGGAQSNAMLSIAYLCAMKGWEFHYYTKKLPRWLESDYTGNLKRAIELGMNLHQLPAGDFYDEVEKVGREICDTELFIPQGGADPAAREGVALLASEIMDWSDRRGIETFCVATPSGTGTTALYLRESLPDDVLVVTTPVVGDTTTLRLQWSRLCANSAVEPEILFSFGKHPFAKPHPRFFETWESLLQSGIEFDLIYAPKMWIELENFYESLPKPIVYVHSGGVSGNLSQSARYLRQ